MVKTPPNGDHPALLDWLDYPFRDDDGCFPGKGRVYYRERLLKDSERIFEPEEIDFDLLRVSFDCLGKSKPGATHAPFQHDLPCSRQRSSRTQSLQVLETSLP